MCVISVCICVCVLSMCVCYMCCVCVVCCVCVWWVGGGESIKRALPMTENSCATGLWTGVQYDIHIVPLDVQVWLCFSSII